MHFSGCTGRRAVVPSPPARAQDVTREEKQRCGRAVAPDRVQGSRLTAATWGREREEDRGGEREKEEERRREEKRGGGQGLSVEAL